MKKVWIVMIAMVMGMFLYGCASLGSKSDSRQAYEKFQKERPDVAYVQTGDQALDKTASLSANIYGTTVKYLNEYIAASENNRAYIGFTNEVNYEIQDNKKSATDAIQATLENIKKSDVEAKTNNYNDVIVAMNALNALKPENKLAELAPLGTQAVEVAASASKLKNSFTSFDTTVLTKLQSAKNILNQANYTVDALSFLQRQYSIVQETKSYMKE